MTRPSFPDLRGKSALVTGSTRGIGATLADALVDAGMDVYRHGEAAAGDAIVGDLGTDEGIQAVAHAVKARVETLDVLVHNAGIEIPSPISHLDRRELQRTLDVNLVGPILLTRALLPLLQRSSAPSVVNVTSIHDSIPYAGNAAYVASKAGLEAATRTLSLELASAGIRVNAIAPGAIETDMNRPVLESIGRAQFDSWIPLGRVGRTDDLVGALLFLSSEASRYMTGARLPIDGGYSLNLVRYRLDE